MSEIEERIQINTIKEKITWTQRRITSLQGELSELQTGVHSLQEARDTLSSEESKEKLLFTVKLEYAESKRIQQRYHRTPQRYRYQNQDHQAVSAGDQSVD